MDTKKQLLRSLPKVDEAIALIEKHHSGKYPRFLLKLVIRESLDKERMAILENLEKCQSKTVTQWTSFFLQEIEKKIEPNFKRVINGSGIVVHTNLGRSLLSKEAGKSLDEAGTYFSNLEFNLQTGKRGSRYSLVESVICELTGAEAALVVNNNAAAVLLVLETLAKGQEAIVSRGQLVEIGGSFRIPDVMRKSGVHLVEVGATNRTHLRDYENSITENTALLLKVHTSNFRIVGFTSEVSAEELVGLVKDSNIAVMEDLGSGCMVDLSPYGLPKEPTVQEVVKAGVDVVTFSGDKLLGGPQAGIIVGKKDIIDRIKKNPLNRALRIDKFTLAALESILRNYYDLEAALTKIPTLYMITQDDKVIKKRARRVISRIKKKLEKYCYIELEETLSKVGGGALPEYNLKSWALSFSPHNIGLNNLERKMRQSTIPIIGRMENEKFLIDFRTIQDREVVQLSNHLIKIFI